MSEDHVALTRCYFCGEGSTILLATRYTGQGRDMRPVHSLKPLHDKVIDMEPCSKCAGYMKQGIIILTIDESLSEPGWEKPEPIRYKESSWGPEKTRPGIPNPYRTGGFFVVTEDCIRRMIDDKALREQTLKCRFLFVEHKAAKAMGLYEAKPKGTE